MTSKEIIERALRLEATPRLPVSLLSAGAWTLNRHGLTLEGALGAGPERIAEVIARTNELVRCDIVWPGSGYHNLALRAVGGKIKFRAKGTPDVQEPLLRTPSDVERVRLDRVREDPGIRALVGAASILSRSIGSTTVVGTSQWAPFTLGALAYGAEHVMRGIYKDKPAVHAILGFAADLCFAYLEPFIEAGVSMISLADPTSSGDMVSRDQFLEFSLPYLTKVAARVKARGVRVLVHICGDTTNRLEAIPGGGAELMSVDYKVDLAAARRVLGGRIAFAGNMNPAAVMQDQTPEGVAAACRACIRSAGPGPGYVLMPGCDIPPTVPIENVRAMVETAHAHPCAEP
ncbi:uroporphyrinogen decarboxylase family protein [Anaeromyxobacter oryzisoli]|uniref:uroporphyrinogen decarboxylase family protein n=1 Tax=Anaeromyxobacter oryzisoli TaxID=2925408 RepID=UPI001F5699FA|nr:uroporphyrinogen decarboxylase family protein [Anaeromyxobacter sp. SG63]